MYQDSLKKTNTSAGQYLSPTIGEWFSGVPLGWTKNAPMPMKDVQSIKDRFGLHSVSHTQRKFQLHPLSQTVLQFARQQ